MELTIVQSSYEWHFKLHSIAHDVVDLMCNGYAILRISPDGLYRYQNVDVKGIPVDSCGRIRIKGEIDKRDEYRSRGKNDVMLKLSSESERTLYIHAYKGDEQSTLCYLNTDGLYIWIDSDHRDNCYACSKHDTILLLE